MRCWLHRALSSLAAALLSLLFWLQQVRVLQVVSAAAAPRGEVSVGYGAAGLSCGVRQQRVYWQQEHERWKP